MKILGLKINMKQIVALAIGAFLLLIAFQNFTYDPPYNNSGTPNLSLEEHYLGLSIFIMPGILLFLYGTGFLSRLIGGKRK
jgi:hypothetical protein